MKIHDQLVDHVNMAWSIDVNFWQTHRHEGASIVQTHRHEVLPLFYI